MYDSDSDHDSMPRLMSSSDEDSDVERRAALSDLGQFVWTSSESEPDTFDERHVYASDLETFFHCTMDGEARSCCDEDARPVPEIENFSFGERVGGSDEFHGC